MVVPPPPRVGAGTKLANTGTGAEMAIAVTDAAALGGLMKVLLGAAENAIGYSKIRANV